METLNKYFKIAKTVYKDELTINEFFAAYQELKEGEEAIKAELKTKTVKVLNSVYYQLGNFPDSRYKKGGLINRIFESLTSCFLLNRNVSYFLGEETHDTAKEKMILGVTAETLNKFYTERQEKKEATAKAIENPQTIEEFRKFIEVKGLENLTPEQIATFEQLKADITLKRQEQEQERQNTVTKINIDNVDFDIHPTKHSKTGADIYTVLMLNRVEKEDFNVLRAKAKKMGGYYSRYTDKNANPPIKAGFNFDTEEDARAFIGLKEEDQNTAGKQEERAEEVKQSAAERMKERARAIIEKGEESANQDRRTNTHRQAAQAASSEAKAQNEIIFGKKLLLIAEGLENGSIKYLHAIRNGKQLEQLETILSRGFYNRTKKLTYTEREREQKEPLKDVNFIVYPFPTYGTEVLKSIFLEYDTTPGMKKGVKTLLEYERRNQKDGLVIFEGEYIIKTLKETASKIRDKWDNERILESVKNYERIQKMGLTNESILKTALRELINLTAGTGPSEETIKANQLKELERSFISKKIPGFFPTPELLINRMFSMAKVFENETILEPSAGLGHIAEAIKERYPDNNLNVIEYNYQLSEVLEKKGFNVENEDFLKTTKKYDVIFMNPPFENHQDIEHVKHAFTLLNPGGRLVSIMAGNKNEGSSNKKIIDFLEFIEQNGYIQQNEEGSFKSAFNSTNVNTITVYLESAEQAEEAPQVEEIQVYEAQTIEAPQYREQLTLF